MQDQSKTDRSIVHRTRTRHPERKSKSQGNCGSYRVRRERRNSKISTSTQALLPISTHSNGFCIIRVCISSSSSSTRAQTCYKPVFHGYVAAFGQGTAAAQAMAITSSSGDSLYKLTRRLPLETSLSSLSFSSREAQEGAPFEVVAH